MPRFATLNNLLSSVQALLERCLINNLPTGSTLLTNSLTFLRNVRSSTPPESTLDSALQGWEGFERHIINTELLLRDYDPDSPEVTAALNDLRAFSPVPFAEVVPREVWGTALVTSRAHLKSGFKDAVANITATGRTLSPDDEHYLRLILTHPCGWSPTYTEHMNDDWVKFFQMEYPHLEGLVPILDSLTYMEELIHLPYGLRPTRPTFFLLATSECYYVYDFSDGAESMCRVGFTLEDVYTGMNDYLYAGFQDNAWPEEDGECWGDAKDYLPVFYRKENGRFGRVWSNKEFP
jgi:hypothetical protein